MNYYIGAVLGVLEGGPLNARDKYSFDLPPILSQEDWENIPYKTWTEAEYLATQIERLPESKLWDDFFDNKYGNYFRNIQGVIEHIHYHLGQIVLIKKILQQSDKN